MALSTSQSILGASFGAPTQTRSVYFVSDSTGITAETLGQTLLTQFPGVQFRCETIPFVNTPALAHEVVERVDADSVRHGETAIILSTVVLEPVRDVIMSSTSVVIDLLGEQLQSLERVLGERSAHTSGKAHGVGDLQRYFGRMQAVEFAIEHDDGQSLRALKQADLILIAPSRCGKTPTTMYLALQHGLFVANYPLVDEDFESDELPKPIRALSDRCFGLLSTPQRLSEVRQQRRPDSTYASLEQCTRELRFAERMYRSHRIPYLNSSAKSVEEMATVILHTRSRST